MFLKVFCSLYEGCHAICIWDLIPFFQGSVFPLILLWFMQGSLFPLPGFVCPFVLLVSNLYYKLVLLFLIYTILTFDKKKNKYRSVEMASSLSHHIRNICVFGGFSHGKESANHLSQVLAEKKIHLVYGGGSLGLMGGCVNNCIFRR